MGEYLSDIYMWNSVQMTSMENYLEDTCGKLSVDRVEVCDRRTSVELYLQGICENQSEGQMSKQC